MASILLTILRISSPQSKCNYPKNENFFLSFFSISGIYIKSFFFPFLLLSGQSKIFTVRNYGNTLTMTILLFFEMLKIWFRFQKWNKKSRKRLNFLRYCIWIGSCKFSQSETGYLPSTANLLTNTTKTSPNTRGDILQINFLENDKKTWQNCSHRSFPSICDGFTCWLSKRVLKRRFL